MNNALTKWKPLLLTIYKYILFQIVEVEWTDSELFKGKLLSSYAAVVFLKRHCPSILLERNVNVKERY